MEIGTAAPSQEQLRKVRHYFVHELEPDTYYNAAQYEKEVLVILEQLFQNHEIILLSGGSMMYIDAVCKGIDDLPNVDEGLRKQLKEQVEKEGLDSIRQQLKLLDPEFYNQVDLKNTQRVIHALEICLMTGVPYSSLRTQKIRKRPFEIQKIGLFRDREELYSRINQRVENMITEGLELECKNLMHYSHCNALNTVGYKEMAKYLNGEWSLDMAIEKIKQNTRIYSRKQMTWFKRDKDIHWINLSQIAQETALKEIIELTGSKKI